MSKQPNILLFLTDGVQGQVINRPGACVTPNLDRLAGRGVRFRRAYTPSPTCSPARASLMTGLLPHNHGVLQVEHCVDSDQSVLRDVPHFAQRLSVAGYRTGYFGKWHVERTNRVADFGWQQSWVAGADVYDHLRDKPAGDEAMLDPQRWFEGPEGYKRLPHYGVTDQTLDQRPAARTVRFAQQFLSEAMAADQPWCCCVSFPEPNETLLATREALGQYAIDQIELPANLRDPMTDKPALYRRHRDVFASMSDQQWREARACYLARITELDTLLGRLIDQLAAAGQLKNTVIVYTSDHGRYVGGHGLESHSVGGFEENYNIPMVVAGPGVATGVSNAWVGLHDVGPTLLELAGAEAIGAPDSKSFAPVLRDPKAPGSGGGLAEYHGTRFNLTQRVYWEDNWKLVFNGFDYDELYDLSNDPEELHNLAAHPEHAERLKRMTAAMWGVIRDTKDRSILQSHYYWMRNAAVGPEAATP